MATHLGYVYKKIFKPSKDSGGGLLHNEDDWKFKYLKMESRYEEEKMACVYNIMEKNKLRKETEDFQTQWKKSIKRSRHAEWLHARRLKFICF